MGQNFLVDYKVVDKIVQSLEITKDDVVVELGAGKGVLTHQLVELAGTVIAIELDYPLCRLLVRTLGMKNNFHLKEMDILKVDFAELCAEFGCKRVKVVGNLPYNITSPILFKLIDDREYIAEAVVMMQLEVAQRLAAKPGRKSYGVPTIITQMYSQPDLLFTVPPKAFLPAPKVQSAVLKLTWLDQPAVDLADDELFFQVVRKVFSKRRKMLRKSLQSIAPIQKEHVAQLESKTGIDMTRRPETLSLDEFAALTTAILDLRHDDQSRPEGEG